MLFFNSLWQTLQNWDGKDPLSISGPSPEHWMFFLSHFKTQGLPLFQRPQLLICPDTERAENIFQSLARNFPGEVLHFPGLEVSPYGGAVPSHDNVHRQFYAMSKIALWPDVPWIIVTTVEAALLKIPPPDFFADKKLTTLTKGEGPDPQTLGERLVALGYFSSHRAMEPGTFCRKGEIFDVYPLAEDPVRIHYFDDTIEDIFAIDSRDYTTLKEKPRQRVLLSSAPLALASEPHSRSLRGQLPSFGPDQKARFNRRKQYLATLAESRLFEDFPFFIPLFFRKPASLLDYFDKTLPVVTFLESSQCQQTRLELLEELRAEHQREIGDQSGSLLSPAPKQIYHHDLKISNALQIERFNNSLEESAHFPLEDTSAYLHRNTAPASRSSSKSDFLKQVIIFLNKEFKSGGDVVFASGNQSVIDEFKYMLDLFDEGFVLRNKIIYSDTLPSSGFFYPSEKTLLITDADIFVQKKAKAKQSVSHDIDLFAEQMASLKPGDYVVHSEYGLGKFIGLQSLEVSETDFMVLLYDNDDKVYVPVYKFDLVQKYAESSSQTKLDSLRNNKFLAIKKKARQSAKKLAFDLVKLQAEREISKSFSFSPPDHEYKEFELSFPFQETPDQISAIASVLEDMQKERPMDRLICGDVGFGKTEIAMRAAFKAVEDRKQVAILVPTTILAFQHYVSFTSRFKDFPIAIEFLSRFKNPRESALICERLSKGEIDIVIGTHKLLSKNIKFSDLGLVVVDEEQRFGVSHKEKLKLLKHNVDFMTLTATPIPRTLQLAFLGLRDLSLIQTAPPKRQSIKSFVIRESWETIQKAIEKELSRGGQVFIVHNRVHDIEAYKNNIAELVPNAKIMIAHGQLRERELERRIKAFYSGEYQILVSTTIIENGIDIPNANTMIIDRADTYGLAQLHQLRGRIGRSDRKAYAYFIIPKHLPTSSLAQKRLKALQTYADVGGGLNIASCDLEIRGAGDILGAEQSGHIETVGLELYMQLLKESIQEIKGEKRSVRSNMEITTPFSAQIPHNYIEDDSSRMKYYKQISNLQNSDQLESIIAKIEDIYGPIPQELDNLFTILHCRILMQALGAKHLSLNRQNICLSFDQELLSRNTDLRDSLVQTFLQQPDIYRFSPNFEVRCRLNKKIDLTILLNFCRSISEQINQL